MCVCVCVVELSLGLLHLLVVHRSRGCLRYREIKELLAWVCLALPWLQPQTGSAMSLQYSLALCGLQTLCFDKLLPVRQISNAPTATGNLMVASHSSLVAYPSISTLWQLVSMHSEEDAVEVFIERSNLMDMI